jgi:hypothetical protein
LEETKHQPILHLHLANRLIMTASTISAEDFKATLPTNWKGVVWNIETFSTYVNLRYPHVTVKGGQEWRGIMKDGVNQRYTFLCSKHGEYEAKASHILALNLGCQCRKCYDETCALSAGKKRRPKATKEEKQLAAELYAELGNYCEVARRLGRSHGAIIKWLDPDYAKRHAAYTAHRYQNPAVRERQKLTDKLYSVYEHGKANRRASKSKRRALEWEALFSVLIDGVWHQVDMSQYLKNWDDRQMFVDFKSCEDYAQLQATCKELAEIHGEEFHVDHLVSLSAGGLHCTENFQIKPASINLSKNNKRIPADDALFCKRIFNIPNT